MTKLLTVKPKTPALLRTGELAGMLGVCPATVLLWRRKGYIPAPTLTIGRHSRWNPDEVLKAIARHQRAAEKCQS